MAKKAANRVKPSGVAVAAAQPPGYLNAVIDLSHHNQSPIFSKQKQLASSALFTRHHRARITPILSTAQIAKLRSIWGCFGAYITSAPEQMECSRPISC